MTRFDFFQVIAAAFQVEQARPQYAFFKDAEIRLMRDFFRPGGGNPPPCQVKKEPISPALFKQIRRGGTFPENLKADVFPPALAKQLPDPPADYERVLFQRWVLLIQAGTRLIVDIIDLI